MGISKTNLFTLEQNQFAKLAKAFSHPARVAIVQHLVECNTCINSDLVEELGLAQATISQHLRELKEVGLIQGSIEGTSMNYCINPIIWKESQSTFSKLFRSFTNCC
ncbi:MAG: metalloregulator ArsR/SmtB family transcription factor [Balneolaceae bacterium]